MRTTSSIVFATSALLATTSGERFIGSVTMLPLNESTTEGHDIKLSVYYPSCAVALDVDFLGGDLKSVNGAQGQCCGFCDTTSGCVGYTWNNYQGGTCWLKGSIGTAEVKYGVWASFFRPAGAAVGLAIAKFQDCDMPGNDVSSAKEASIKDCYRHFYVYVNRRFHHGTAPVRCRQRSGANQC